ncbi:hypothetical protein RB213_001117 [Colletotrichum asianum]
MTFCIARDTDPARSPASARLPREERDINTATRNKEQWHASLRRPPVVSGTERHLHIYSSGTKLAPPPPCPHPEQDP